MTKKRKKREAIECIQVRPPACPKCGCTDRTNTDGVKKRDIAGKTVDGRLFTQVKWSYCNCRKCNQRYAFVSYLAPASAPAEKTD